MGGAVMTAVLAGSGMTLGASAIAAPTAHVRIKDIDFGPHKLTVKRGTTVRWTFEDDSTPHNVTSRGHLKFRSSPTKQSGAYSVRFTKPGTYAYVCTIHFNMKARIVVR
jgi:plastocyanin